MIDVYIWIGVWVVILLFLIISLMKIENEIADDRINKLFEETKEMRLAMPRYIDAEALKPDYIVGSTSTNTECYRYVSLKQIENAPTADVVEVVRCKDCRYWKTETEPIGIECEPGEDAHYCEMDGMITRTADFCSYGHRK